MQKLKKIQFFLNLAKSKNSILTTKYTLHTKEVHDTSMEFLAPKYGR